MAQPDYASYIIASYAATTVLLMWLLITSANALRRSRMRLKQLQNSLEPDSENAADNAA